MTASWGEIITILEDRFKIQKDLDRIEHWALSNSSIVRKSKVLHLGRKKQQLKYKISSTWFNSSMCARVLCVLMGDHLNMSQQCTAAAQKKSQCSPRFHQQKDSIKTMKSDSTALHCDSKTIFRIMTTASRFDYHNTKKML